MKTIEELIIKGNFPPVIMLFGEEEYLIEEALNKLISRLILTENDKYNYDNFNCEDKEVTAERIAGLCNSYPMMSEKKVIVLRNFDSLFPLNKGKSKELESSPLVKYLKSPLESTILVLTAELSSYKGLLKELKKGQSAFDKKVTSMKLPYSIIFDKYLWFEYPKIWENQLQPWIVKRFNAEGYEIMQDAAMLIYLQNDSDLRALAGVIEKIITFSYQCKTITSDIVHYATGQSKNYNVFNLQNAVGNKDIEKSLMIINQILSVSNEEIAIISILTKYFSILWKLIEELKKNPAEAAKNSGITPYFFEDYKKATEKYSPSQINNAFFELFEADKAIKSTQADNNYVIQKMIIGIITS